MVILYSEAELTGPAFSLLCDAATVRQQSVLRHATII